MQPARAGLGTLALTVASAALLAAGQANAAAYPVFCQAIARHSPFSGPAGLYLATLEFAGTRQTVKLVRMR